MVDNNAKRRYDRLVDDIADMIAKQTYNRAPINYGIAERAIAMVVRRRVRPLERALREVRAGLGYGYASRTDIVAYIDGVLKQTGATR